MPLLFVFTGLIANAQNESQRLTKYPIVNSGMKVSLPQAPGTWKIEYSDDSSKIFEAEVPWEDFTFRVIAVQFKNPVQEDDLDDLLINYLDHLKSVFDTREAGGYVKGHTLSTNKSARGIVDYWTSRDKTETNLKAWINPYNLAVLMISGSKPFKLYQVTKEFHDSIEFPTH